MTSGGSYSRIKKKGQFFNFLLMGKKIYVFGLQIPCSRFQTLCFILLSPYFQTNLPFPRVNSGEIAPRDISWICYLTRVIVTIVQKNMKIRHSGYPPRVHPGYYCQNCLINMDSGGYTFTWIWGKRGQRDWRKFQDKCRGANLSEPSTTTS